LGLEIEAMSGAVPEADGWLNGSGSSFAMMSFLLTLLAAVAGGFILNAMPCVFPILSLKALSLARSGESQGAARTEALAYSAGIILTCMALGGAILLLRAGGESVGWAFQLQNPHIILVLLLLMTTIGLNLAGLFDLPSLSFNRRQSRDDKPSEAFLTGVLAAFVATPCTGPFMGLALGSALFLPSAAALGVFAGLGFGLALPFLLIGYIPALRARLPKPGAWMSTFRRVLAVPMLLTALGLGWVLGRQSGTNALMLGMAGAVLLALALWWLGLRQKRGSSAGITIVALVAAIALPLGLSARFASPATPVATTAGQAAFSEARLADLRARDKPVFVYFTADWCLTCKVNEKTAIERVSVRAAFDRKGIEVLVGDWTSGDPAISRFLESMGRSGVPLYLFYPAGGGAPQILPQILTPSLLEELGS
jgi:thiol:disulfide interchange protein